MQRACVACSTQTRTFDPQSEYRVQSASKTFLNYQSAFAAETPAESPAEAPVTCASAQEPPAEAMVAFADAAESQAEAPVACVSQASSY